MVAAACMRGSFLREAPSIILQFGWENFVFSIDGCLWGRLYGGSTVFNKIISNNLSWAFFHSAVILK